MANLWFRQTLICEEMGALYVGRKEEGEACLVLVYMIITSQWIVIQLQQKHILSGEQCLVDVTPDMYFQSNKAILDVRFARNGITLVISFEANYRKNYCLDKDILIPGNKIYSPETCCLVPNEINVLFSYKRKKRELPIGVVYIKHMNKYAARIHHNGKEKYLCFTNNIKEAFDVYKETKRLVIQETAERWKNRIDKKSMSVCYNTR